MSLWKQALLCVVLLALGAGGWYVARNPQLIGMDRTSGAGGSRAPGSSGAGGGGPGGSRGGQVLVVAAPVESDTAAARVISIGSAKAAQSVTLFPQVTGVVDAISFTPGKHVDAGTPLVHLEAAEQKVALDRARATLAQAQAATERAQRLVASKAVAAVTLSDAQTAQVLAETDVQNAQIGLDRRTLRAPFAGVPGIADLSIGDLVQPTTKIVTLDDLSTVLVDFEVPERWAGKIALGQPISGTVPGYPGKTFAGQVSAIDSRVDETARTLRMQAKLANDQGLLKPGMAVTVTLEFPGEERPSVPSLAVQWDRDGSFVWKLDGNKVHRQPVTVLQRESGVVIVQGGVKPKDEVVVEGVQRLRDGASVARAEASAAGAEGSPPPGDMGQPKAPSNTGANTGASFSASSAGRG